MRVLFSDRFARQEVRRGARDIWQARVNGGWRFYFRIEGDLYHLIDITPHPK